MSYCHCDLSMFCLSGSSHNDRAKDLGKGLSAFVILGSLDTIGGGMTVRVIGFTYLVMSPLKRYPSPVPRGFQAAEWGLHPGLVHPSCFLEFRVLREGRPLS